MEKENMTQTLLHTISSYCQSLEKEFDQIPASRKGELQSLSQYIAQKNQQGRQAQAIVICTHNSRRSHLGQLWLSIGADYYQLPPVASFSGGTEATAFNPRAVAALDRIGLDIQTSDATTSNPIYEIKWMGTQEIYQAFSKKYDHPANPQSEFAAIMVCSEADAGCPIVAGCDFRLPLPYDDPKAFDETDLESQKYDERCRQIGREMLYALHQVKIAK